jgi:hypothetical protein
MKRYKMSKKEALLQPLMMRRDYGKSEDKKKNVTEKDSIEDYDNVKSKKVIEDYDSYR